MPIDELELQSKSQDAPAFVFMHLSWHAPGFCPAHPYTYPSQDSTTVNCVPGPANSKHDLSPFRDPDSSEWRCLSYLEIDSSSQAPGAPSSTAQRIPKVAFEEVA